MQMKDNISWGSQTADKFPERLFLVYLSLLGHDSPFPFFKLDFILFLYCFLIKSKSLLYTIYELYINEVNKMIKNNLCSYLNNLFSPLINDDDSIRTPLSQHENQAILDLGNNARLGLFNDIKNGNY